jgi:hypothetical protein
MSSDVLLIDWLFLAKGDVWDKVNVEASQGLESAVMFVFAVVKRYRGFVW